MSLVAAMKYGSEGIFDLLKQLLMWIITRELMKKFHSARWYLGAPPTEKFQSRMDLAAVYRRDVSKEIREALLNVPNSRIEGVSVEKLEISGDYVAKTGVLEEDSK